MTKRLNETTAQMDCAIGSRIRSMRILRGLSQGVLAEKLGITFQQVQKYEKGANRVAASTLVIISGVLQVSPLEILGLEAGIPIDTSAFSDLARRNRDLEARIARAKRALGSFEEEVETSLDVSVRVDDSGKMEAFARASPPN